MPAPPRRLKLFGATAVRFAAEERPNAAARSTRRSLQNDRRHLRDLAKARPQATISRPGRRTAPAARHHPRVHLHRAVREPLRARQDALAFVLPRRSGGERLEKSRTPSPCAGSRAGGNILRLSIADCRRDPGLRHVRARAGSRRQPFQARLTAALVHDSATAAIRRSKSW